MSTDALKTWITDRMENLGAIKARGEANLQEIEKKLWLHNCDGAIRFGEDILKKMEEIEEEDRVKIGDGAYVSLLKEMVVRRNNWQRWVTRCIIIGSVFNGVTIFILWWLLRENLK